MARESRKPRKDRTSLVISTVLHVVVIGGVLVWAWKTGKLEEVTNRILQVVTDEKKKTETKPAPVRQQPAPSPKLPPINQGSQSPASRGTRMAVASDAPQAAGNSFFEDNREQVNGPASSGGSGDKTKDKVAVAPVSKPPPPKAAFGPALKTTIKQLFAERAKEAAAVEAVGSEQISKAAANDAGAVVSKVAGASIVDGKYAVIRGLSDRYISTTFNGGEIPSADPYRRSPSLDMFPAQVIDKVVISKTFTPDQPGTSTGGGINIVSKSFPEKLFVSLSFGAAYNTQATGNKDFLTYDGGSKDWLGMDDGSRALPAPLNDLGTLIPPPVTTTGPNRPTNPNFAANVQNAENLNAFSKLMGATPFAPSREAAPWNQNFNLAMGDTAYLLGKPFGVFAGLNYRREFNSYSDGVTRRYEPTSGGATAVSYEATDARSTDIVNWGTMISLAYQWLPNHSIGLNYLFNQNGTDYARVQQGVDPEEPTYTVYQNRLHFTERTLNSYQFKGEDMFPTLGDLKLDWAATTSDTTQDEPDVRFFNYYNKGGTYVVGDNGLPDPNLPTRYFRLLEEQNKNFKADLTLPFHQWSGDEGQLKAGFFDSGSERQFQERQIYYPGGEFDGDPNHYLTEDNLGYVNPPVTNANNGRIAYTWNRYIQSFDSLYDAENKVRATYLMLDTPVTERLRVVGGARVESTDIQIHSESYAASGVTGQRVNDTVLQQTDLLPALGFIITLRSNMNLRLHYSETIARPSIRELAAYRSYDPDLDVLVEGNPLLRVSSIRNYDIRWEWFPLPGDLLSVSYYQKELTDAIEKQYVDVTENIVTYKNRPAATVTGLEFEARKNLRFISPALRDWSIGGNLSLVKSEAALSEVEVFNKRSFGVETGSTRALYDQSPYILNVDLNYDNARTGTSASLIFNAAGPRISIATLRTEDIYEHPPSTLDFVLSQKIGRNMSLRFTARNLLDPDIKRTYGESGSQLYSSYKRGLTFGTSLTYEF
jgi:TonB-dependent receptor